MKHSVFTPVIAIFLCAAVLLGVSFDLNGVAAANAQKAHLEMMQLLLPGSETFTLEPYSGEDSNIVSVHKAENGFAIKTCAYGYAGSITMLIGVNNDGRVTGLVVQEMHETFGLGAQGLTDHVFLSQFLNISGSFAIVSADADSFSGATETGAPAGGEISVDALTGATVTSRAIVRCVNSAVAYVTGADASSGATSWGG